MRLSELENRTEMAFLDLLFARNAVLQFSVSHGLVSVIARLPNGATEFRFRPEHARCIAFGIQRVCLGDDMLSRGLTPVSDQLLDMVGRIEHGVDAASVRH